MSVSLSSSYSEHHAKMVAAFTPVDPTGRTGSWKGPIETRGARGALAGACAHFGVSFQDMLDSIEYFTATKAKVTELGGGAVLITADGYRAGPAGDH